MRSQHDTLYRLIEPAVAVLGYELVGIHFWPQGKRTLLRVYIDSNRGIAVGDCERVSHQVSGVLDVHNPISGPYTLEVSSPGLDRPLFAPSDFERFKGRRIKLRLNAPLHGRRNFSGVLMGFRDGMVLIQADDIEHSLPVALIGTARLVPEL